MEDDPPLPNLEFPKDFFKEKMTAVLSTAKAIDIVDYLIGLFSRQEDGARRLAQREGLAKEMMDELHPVAVFARDCLQHEMPGSTVQLTGGANRHDARVDVSDGQGPIQFLEVTCLEDASHHRMRTHVEKHGFLETLWDPAVEHERLANLFRRRLASKCAPSKDGRSYPPNTVLLVFVKDTVPKTWIEAIPGIVSAQGNFFQTFSRICVFDRKRTYFDSSKVLHSPS